MYNICLRITGNKQDAEDILQDAFCLAFTNYRQLKSLDSFGAWLKKITINQCIKFLRSRVHFTDLDISNHELPVENDHWMNELSMHDVNNEIKKLPDGCRIIFNLYLLENYSHKQISELLKISESTSKSQYRRAKYLLRKQLIKNV